MIPDIECKYTDDKKYAKPVHKFLYFERPSMSVRTVIMVVMFVLSVALVIYSAVMNVFRLTSVLPLILCVVYFVVRFVGYRLALNTYLRRFDETYGDNENFVTVTATDEGMHFETSMRGEQTIAWKSVRKIYIRKEFAVIYTNARLIYYLPREGFTKGSPEDLAAYARQKGVKA